MKRASAKEIAALLRTNVGRSDEPTLLHDRAAQIAYEQGYVGSLDAAFELVEPILDEVKVLMSIAQADAEESGVSWNAELYGSEDEYIRGSSFLDPSLEAATSRVRANRAHVASVETELRALTPGEFEQACTTTLRLMGCQNPKTSPTRNDGGIDFYGRLELKGRLDAPLPYGGVDRRAGIWLIGQAKHYPVRAIQTAHLRELVGSVELARTGGAIHIWDGLALRPFDATLQLIFTTGHFSSGALRLLSQTGMLSMDGKQLATFLCDASVGFLEGDSTFDALRFKSALVGRAI